MKGIWPYLKPLLLFSVMYAALTIPWVGANQAYAKLFSQLGNWLYEDFSGGGFVRLTVQDDQGKNDIALFISKSEWKKEGKLIGVTTSKASDRIGYLITAFFAAMTLATPISWKRKIAALFAGLVIVTAYVILKLRIIILYSYTQVPWFDMFQQEPAKSRIIWWYEHVAANATQGFVIVFITWLILVTGKKEWYRIISMLPK